MEDITDCLRNIEVCALAYCVDCALVQPHLTEAFAWIINCHFLQIKLLWIRILNDFTITEPYLLVRERAMFLLCRI